MWCGAVVAYVGRHTSTPILFLEAGFSWNSKQGYWRRGKYATRRVRKGKPPGGRRGVKVWKQQPSAKHLRALAELPEEVHIAFDQFITGVGVAHIVPKLPTLVKCP